MKTDLKGVTGLRVEAIADKSLPAGGPGRAGNGNFVLSEVEAYAALLPIDFEKAVAKATFEQEKFPASAVLDAEDGKNNGWAVGGGVGRDHNLTIELEKPILFEGNDTALFLTLTMNHGDNHVLGRYRLWMTKQPKPLLPVSGKLPPREIAQILALAADQRTPAQMAALTKHFRSVAPEFAALRSKLDAARKSKTDLEASVGRCIVSVSMATPRAVRILPRGNWLDDSGPVMSPALPAFLAKDAPAVDRRLTRLDLAEWVVSPENPLTARVFVNRVWKQFFGTGLSKSLDDLGAQGEWPSHPELLDWLAVEFRDGSRGERRRSEPSGSAPAQPGDVPKSLAGSQSPSAWDMKRLVRTIVLSATYRQSSVAPKELLARDPENRLLARQSRFRLDAELVRDNALAVSGLLSLKVGGPSVKPYQPDGYWENLNFPTRTWAADSGDSQYRRGLYTWWQRSFLHPSLLAFDAPAREECAADRTRSNIPQQALVLLNDPTYVEAARAFAVRMMKEGGAEADARLDWAWRQALQRPASREERAAVRAVVDKHQAHFVSHPAEAAALLKVGFAPPPVEVPPAELAAWTSAARILLNLHETITRQ